MGFNSYTGVNVPFTADNKKFVAAMRESQGAVGALKAEMSIGLTNAYSQLDYMQRRLDTGIGRTADSVKKLGANMTSYITVPFAMAGAAAMKFYFDMDGIVRGFDAITGSSKTTASYMRQFLEVAKLPGLGFKEVAQHGLVWAALGKNIGDTKKLMLEFGNANALGGKGKAEFDTIMFQLTQLQSKGKVVAEDLKPILNASPIIARTLKDRYNTTDSGDIQKQLEKAGLNSNAFIDNLITDLSKLERVTGGAKNAWENFTDSLFIAAASVGEFIEKGIGFGDLMDDIGESLRSFAKWLSEMDPNMRRWIASTLLFVVAAGPMLNVLGTAVKLFASFSTLGSIVNTAVVAMRGLWAVVLANPYTALAAGILTAIVAIGAYNSALSKTEQIQQNVKKIQSDAIANGQAEVSMLNSLVKTASNENTSKAEKAKAIKKINELSPEYLGNITEENIRTAAVTTQIGRYNTFIVQKMQYEMIANELAANNLKFLKKMNEDPAGNLGLMNTLMYGKETATKIARNEKFSEAKEILKEKEALVKVMQAIKPGYNQALGNMEGYYQAPDYRAGGGGKAGTIAKIKDEARAAIDALNDLEKEMTKFDADNGLSYLKDRNFNTLNPNGFDTWAGGNKVKADGGFTKEGISAWGDGMIGKFKVPEIKSNLTDLSDTYRNGLQNIAGGITDGLSQMASAWVDGTFKWQSAGAEFTGLLGQMMVTLGQSFVTMGIAKLAADLLATSTLGGGALIAIGAGLQVAGGAVKGQANKWGKGGQLGGSAGSVGSYSSPTYSGTSSGYGGGANAPLKIDLNLTGNFRIAGSDLVLAISRQTTLNANR